MAFDSNKPLKKVGNIPVPQYWNDDIEDWEVVKGSAGSYRTQSSIKLAKEPFNGSANLTKEFASEMNGFVISNDGNADLTFTIGVDTYTVKAGEVFEEEFTAFTTVSITSSVAYRAYGKVVVGGVVSVPTTPTDTTAPDNVTNLASSGITQNSLMLSWTASASSDCVGYDVYRGATLIGSVTGTVFNVTGLTASTQYTFFVKAKDAANNIASGTSIPATTLAQPADVTPPANVTGLGSSAITATGVTLSWTASVSSDIKDYNVYNGSTLITTVTGVSYNVTGLTASTAYTFTVKARDTANNEASGLQVGVTTTAAADTTAPTVTASPAAGTFTSTQSVTLSANETATIYYTTNGSTPDTNSTQYSSAIAINATTTLKFFGRDTAGNSSAVQTAAYTINLADTTAPNPVTGLSAGTLTSNSVSLSWTLSSSGDVATHEIAYSTDGTNFTVASAVVNAASNTYSVTGLSASTAYTFRVVAVDGANNRSTAVTTTATTAAPTGKVNDASLILYQDTPAVNQTISSPDTYFQTNTQWTAFATIKPVLNSNAATKIFSRQTPNAILFEFTFANQFKCALYGHATNGTGSAAFPAATDSTARTDFTGYYHVVIVRDGSKLYLYVNDTMVNSANVASDVYVDTSTAPLLFGSHTQSNPPIFKNMGYYSRALTTAELTQNYNALK